MAYALPTMAVTAAPVSPTKNQPFDCKLVITSTGTVGVKIRRVECVVKSGSGKTGIAVLEQTTADNSSPADRADMGRSMAGVNTPTTDTYSTTTGKVERADKLGYVANGGGSATTTFHVPAVAYQSGTLVLKFIAHCTRDDDTETSDVQKMADIQIIAADKSITIQ